MNGFLAEESIIEKTNYSENLPYPLFAKDGEFLPFVKLVRPRPSVGTGAGRQGRGERIDLQ
jgi:hypothetical protein